MRQTGSTVRSMQPVPFTVPGVDGQLLDAQSLGALVDADQYVLDLQRAHEQSHGAASPGLVSLQALIAGGEGVSAGYRDYSQRAN